MVAYPPPSRNAAASNPLIRRSCDCALRSGVRAHRHCRGCSRRHGI